MAKTRKRYLTSDAMNSRYGGYHQKSGKWTAEEEMLADKLIHGFQTGTLTDCAEGATLRSYLARKLNCAPMRISKKFAGQCIGKHTYVINTSNNPQQTTWTSPKSPSQLNKSPRFTRPSRRHSPRSNVSSDSSQYHYYDSDETESTEEDDSYKGPPSAPSLLPARNTRRVTLGSGPSSAFTPITLFPPVSPPTPATTLTPMTPPPTPVRACLKMDPVDFDEVYHSSYSSTPSCCVGGTSCSAHHEEQQWREVLTTLFGETDSSSPVRNIFQKDAGASGGDIGAASGSGVAVSVHQFCYSTPPTSPRGVVSAPYSAISSFPRRDSQSGPSYPAPYHSSNASASSSSSSYAVSYFPRSHSYYP